MGSPKSQLHQTMKFARWPDHASPWQTLESRTKNKNTSNLCISNCI